MKFAEYPFVRYLPFFLGGILLHPRIPVVLLTYISYTLIGLGLILVCLVIINRYRSFYRFKLIIPLLAYTQLLLFGMYVKSQQQERFKQQQELSLDGMTGYAAIVLEHEQQKPNSKLNRIRAKELFYSDTAIRTDVEVLLYHRREHPLKPGDLIWVPQAFQRIEGPRNPAEFNYQAFMGRQGVFYRQFLFQEIAIIGQLQVQPVENFFQTLRFRVQAAFHAHFQNTQARQIANALLLGQKKDLDKEVSEAYATAGAMHILAVSGLHVGIIYGFFFLLWKPYRLAAGKRVLFLSFVIALIWCYALLTGMSPSVMRSATMFTIIALAQMKSRSPSIFNAIALSAFLLLLFDPNLLFSVGFQLSYIALLGILLIQPLLVNLWIPSLRSVEYIWQITTVGIAAQVATFPISAYYFGIFPTYFMLSNLIAIPGAFLIMSVGVPYMLLSEIPLIADALGWLTEHLIRLMNALIGAIQWLPASRLEVDWSLPLTWFYLIAMVLLLILSYHPQKLTAFLLLGLGTAFVAWTWIEGMQQVKQDPYLISYDLNKGKVIDVFVQGRRYSYEDASEEELAFKVEPFRKSLGAKESFPLQLIHKEGQNFLLVPGFGLLAKDSLHTLAEQSWQFDGVKWKTFKPFAEERMNSGAVKVKFATPVENLR
ncbi:MAG: ComEC/Rec2 family competence protein [Mongoliitalea sp.]